LRKCKTAGEIRYDSLSGNTGGIALARTETRRKERRIKRYSQDELKKKRSLVAKDGEIWRCLALGAREDLGSGQSEKKALHIETFGEAHFEKGGGERIGREAL